jgi:uncharacterized membrane protein (UPF0127 family)
VHEVAQWDAFEQTAARPGIQTARGTVSLVRADGTTVCERCDVADRMLPRMKGLLGRREIASGEGLMIRPAPSIHTYFMRFPIDAVFLSRDGEVVKVSEHVKPWRARSARRAYAVLELAAGEAGRRRIAAGDRLRPAPVQS